MELLGRAKTSNDFGLRKRFPWSGPTQNAPWMKTVTNKAEKNFVSDTINDLWNRYPDIKRVENPYLWASYVLRHEELVAFGDNQIKEKIVVHATTSENARSIADENFDWRRACRCRFGRGVSFANDASYAIRYASASSCFIVAGIFQGRSIHGGYTTHIPPDGYDTTTDFRNNVMVKYYDSDYYPYYIAS